MFLFNKNIIYIYIYINLNVLQIYLYNINIYFKLSLDEFQFGLDNIHILFSNYWAGNYPKNTYLFKLGQINIYKV